MQVEHLIIVLVLGIVVLVAGFTGYLTYRVYRLSERAEALTAAAYLEAKKALTQSR